MKIGLIGNLGHSMNETCDEIHMRNILRNFGHEVFDYNNYDREMFLQQKSFTNDYGRTFTVIPNDLDLVVLFKNGLSTQEEVVKLREVTNVKKIIYWCPDLMENCSNDLPRDPTSTQNSHSIIAPLCDYYFSKELGWRKEYEKLGCNFIYFPTNLAPSYIYNNNYERISDDHFLSLCGLNEPTYPVVFTGTFTDIGENRPVFLKELDERIDDLHIFSYNSNCWQERNFKHVHGGLWDDNYKYIIAKSKINIALDWRTDIEGYWSDRINQIQMCGGFVLAKYVNGMEREFGADVVNLVYWNTLDELVEKIEYYLSSNYGERDAIMERGCKNAQVNHSAEQRIREMLTIVKYQ